MPQQFYNLQKTAEVLGVAPADVNQLREQRKLYGYRSGSDWKFKVEEVENLLAERIKARGAGSGDVLSDEVSLGESDPNASGTVIGQSADGGESDIQLADSQPAPDDSEAAPVSDASDVQLEDADDDSEFDLDLTIDEDIVMEDSQFSLAGEDSSTDRGLGGSEVDLASEGEVLDDDDLVLGGASGSGSGSDITIAGDSGISLVDPNDSGLSLEQPVDLSGSDSVSLESDEDDLLTLQAEGDSVTEDLADDEFLLTPMDEGDEDDDSGSQVIALDTGEGDEGATTLGDPDGMVAMLDEETSVEPLGTVGPSMTAGPVVGARTEGALPEAPYGAVWTTMLTLCVGCLGICGILSYDIMRNMWSWSAEYTVNSTIMDTILSFIQ